MIRIKSTQSVNRNNSSEGICENPVFIFSGLQASFFSKAKKKKKESEVREKSTWRGKNYLSGEKWTICWDRSIAGNWKQLSDAISDWGCAWQRKDYLPFFFGANKKLLYSTFRDRTAGLGWPSVAVLEDSMSLRGKGGTESSREWSCVKISKAMGEKLDQSALRCIALKICFLRNSFVLGK